MVALLNMCGSPARTPGTKGFTLVELLVVISIFAIMTTVGVFSFRDYSETTQLDNLSLDIALFVRQAQAVGISGADSSFDPENPTTVDPTGVFLDYSGGSFTNTLTLYRDLDNDYVFDVGDVVLDSARVPASGLVEAFRYNPSNGACVGISDYVQINYERPNPEPIVYFGTGGPALNASLRLVLGVTELSSNRQKFILFENTGQVRILDTIGSC